MLLCQTTYIAHTCPSRIMQRGYRAACKHAQSSHPGWRQGCSTREMIQGTGNGYVLIDEPGVQSPGTSEQFMSGQANPSVRAIPPTRGSGGMLSQENFEI